jgi:hypothetical protein
MKDNQSRDEINDDLNPQKINEELAKVQGSEHAEDASPIAIQAKDEFERALKEEKIASELTTMFVEWESNRRPREAMWQQIYRMFCIIIEKFKTPTRSNITVPIVFQIIEAAVPKIVNTLFAQGDDFFDVKAFDEDDQEARDQATKIKKLLSVQFFKANFYVKFIDFVKQLLMYGTSYMKVYWKVRRDWVWQRVPKRVQRTVFGIPMGETVEWEETKSYQVVEHRPEIEILDIIDVYPDPMALDEQLSRGIFIRSWIDRDELREMGQGKYPMYANTEHHALTATNDTFEAARSERMAARGLSLASGVSQKKVELLEFWGKYDVDGDGIKEECIIVIANRQVILKARGNPFHHQKRPIIRAVFSPIPKEWYGIGLIEPVISQVHELNTLRRQRLDNINLSLNRMWQVNTFADVDLDTLISAPGNIILTDQMDAVKALETNDVTQNAYTEAAQVQNDIERATVPASAQGTPTGGQLGRTARGAQLIIGQALEKFGTATKLIEEMALRKLLTMVHQLNLQFVDDDDLLSNPLLYAEIDNLQIKPEDIRADVKFKMVGVSDMIGAEAKINQIVSFMGVFGKVLSPDSITTLAKKIWQLMGFNKNEIALQGQAPQPGVENVVDPNVSSAILGQAGQQGTQAGAPAIPNLRG